MQMGEPALTTGLIGSSIARSLSPAMHNAAFAHYGLNEGYDLWSIVVDDLPARINALRTDGMRGANVTIPYKSAALSLVDERGRDPDVVALGALNTVVRRPNGTLLGLNTDVDGYLLALRAGGFEPEGAQVVLLGAGGAARGVAWGLVHAGVAALAIANRTAERAQDLRRDLAQIPGRSKTRVAVVPAAGADLRAAVSAATLLINSTSVGSDDTTLPLDAGLLHPGLFVSDLLYRTTPLLRAAAAIGARTQDGLEMLVRQGALSFEAWTELEAPVALMRTAALQARERQQ